MRLAEALEIAADAKKVGVSSLLHVFSRALHQLHVFPRLAPVTRFPALGTSYTFSRAWHQLHVFQRLAPVTRFPALATSYTFSCAWCQIHIFLHLVPSTRFPALDTGYTVFSLGVSRFNRPSSLGRFVFPLQTTWYSLENFSFIHVKFIHSYTREVLFENLKLRILKSIITWSVMGQRNAQAKKV